MQLDKAYEPSRFEPHWAQWWVDHGFFAADAHSSKPMFSLAVPPPNVTGSLHMGHMLEHTLIDMSMRYRRMSGYNTLWLPGMDHAGIATQMVVDRMLLKQGINRHDLGREEFVKRVWQWKEESGGAILNQMKQVGASVDWTRCRFTLDEGLSRAVKEVFCGLNERGLLYRGEYLVNWCPSCGTALSDLEVAHDDVEGKLWHIRYPVIGTDDFLVVATTRPETMLGDTAVAINARDERYLHLHGSRVRLPLLDREIPIILDDMADPAFGSGAVKVTPAHDPNDFEAGKRHDLPRIKVIDEKARMTAEAGPYAGLDRYEARQRVLAALEARGFLVKVDPHPMSVGKCDRCKTVIEPLLSMQWFVRMRPLADKAIAAIEAERIDVQPENWKRTLLHWLENIHDWCVSRQLWWGHRIPAWYRDDTGEIIVARSEEEAKAKAGGAPITQDSDVLDTWFSSGLWPFSTLGWPDRTSDLQTFYPTSLMIMGYEILFLWCARMTMLGLEFMGDVPFRHVYIHGIVRDADKQKMSKTRGNTVDPLDITAKYGTDAVRMALLTSAAPGADIIWTEDKLPSSRAFANKIWNASRFLFLNMERSGVDPQIPPIGQAETLEDRWIWSRLNAAADTISKAIENYRYHEAAQTMWHFFWSDFCDWYIELKKPRFRDGSGVDTHWTNILNVFERALRLLHPAMPFITEELWQRLNPGEGRSISIAEFPKPDPSLVDSAAEAEMARLQEIILAARQHRADLNRPPKETLRFVLEGRVEYAATARDNAEAIAKLANSAIESYGSGSALKLNPLLDAATSAEQGARVAKEIEQLEKVIANSHRQLGDEKFTARAPAHVVDGIRAKLAEYESKLEALRSRRAG
jgi:valyl-tRNA synthetase